MHHPENIVHVMFAQKKNPEQTVDDCMFQRKTFTMNCPKLMENPVKNAEGKNRERQLKISFYIEYAESAFVHVQNLVGYDKACDENKNIDKKIPI